MLLFHWFCFCKYSCLMCIRKMCSLILNMSLLIVYFLSPMLLKVFFFFYFVNFSTLALMCLSYLLFRLKSCQLTHWFAHMNNVFMRWKSHSTMMYHPYFSSLLSGFSIICIALFSHCLMGGAQPFLSAMVISTNSA
jgi:hypothetical protein